MRDEEIVEVGITLIDAGLNVFHTICELVGAVGNVADAIHVGVDQTVCVDSEPTAERLMKAADVENELIV